MITHILGGLHYKNLASNGNIWIKLYVAMLYCLFVFGNWILIMSLKFLKFKIVPNAAEIFQKLWKWKREIKKLNEIGQNYHLISSMITWILGVPYYTNDCIFPQGLFYPFCLAKNFFPLYLIVDLCMNISIIFLLILTFTSSLSHACIALAQLFSFYLA